MADSSILVSGRSIGTEQIDGIDFPKHWEHPTQRDALLAALALRATSANQATIIGHVDGIEASLASLLAKVIAAPSTEAKQDAIKTSIDLINTNVGLVTPNPTANTLQDRLKTIAAAIATGRVLPAATPLLSNVGVSTPAWVGPLPGGLYIWSVSGTFGGTTASLAYRAPDGTSEISTGATLTANGAKRIEVEEGTYVKAILTGGTPSAMYSNLGRVL